MITSNNKAGHHGNDNDNDNKSYVDMQSNAWTASVLQMKKDTGENVKSCFGRQKTVLTTIAKHIQGNWNKTAKEYSYISSDNNYDALKRSQPMTPPWTTSKKQCWTMIAKALTEQEQFKSLQTNVLVL